MLSRYACGDVYEGGLRAGKRHSHGYLKQGKVTTGVASIYIGEWLNDKKSGFGVHSDILKGNSASIQYCTCQLIAD